MRRGGRHHTISEIVGVVYCEQKIVFDLQHGQIRSPQQERAAKAGTRAHENFERTGRVASVDGRCFVASAVYGSEAEETDALRLWRDRVLLAQWWGPLAVRLYYATSPVLVRLMRLAPSLARLARTVLDGFGRRRGLWS
jgi:hypothetical protein